MNAAGRDALLLLDGELVPAADGKVVDVTSPSDEAVVGRAPHATPVDADRALGAARRAFDDGRWSDLPGSRRAEILRGLGALVESVLPDLVALAVDEGGTLAPAAEGMARSALAHVAEAARFAERDHTWSPPPLLAGRGPHRVTHALVRQRPLGVVSALVPFNAPLLLSLTKLAPALAAGNSVVLKPSPQTPLQVLLLARLVAESGIPPGVVQVLTGGADVGAVLCSDRRVDMVTFTGSDRTGQAVMRHAAGALAKVVLELGGKSALLVLDDADLEVATQVGAAHATTLAGQGCALLTRHLVHRSLVRDYVDALTARLGDVVVGHAADPTTTMGPLVDRAARDRVAATVDDARTAGARVECGGAVPVSPATGHYYLPTVLTDVPPGAAVAREEVFGPVVVVVPVDDDQDAVRVANDSEHGLSGGVVSRDVDRALRVADRLRTGWVSINAGAAHDPRLPFGGFGRSGVGREFGPIGAAEFTQSTSIQW